MPSRGEDSNRRLQFLPRAELKCKSRRRMAVLIRAPDLKTIVCYISPESTAIRGRFDATRLIPCTRAGNSKRVAHRYTTRSLLVRCPACSDYR